MNYKKRFGEDCKILWKDRKRFCGLPLSFTRYSIIEKPGQWIKVFCETGILSSHFEEIQMYRIEDFQLNETWTNKIWGVGSIIIKSSDRTAPVFEIKRVKEPYKVYELLTQLVAQDRRSRNFRWGEFSGTDDFYPDV